MRILSRSKLCRDVQGIFKVIEIISEKIKNLVVVHVHPDLDFFECLRRKASLRVTAHSIIASFLGYWTASSKHTSDRFKLASKPAWSNI